MQTTYHSRSGFSFIEMAIAVLVMGILAAVAAPTYWSAISRYRVDMAARKIIADLQYARSEAIRSSQSRTVQFSTGSNSYTLVKVTSLDIAANAYVVDLVDDPYSAVLVSATFGAGTEVIFDMFGRPDFAGTVIVRSGSTQKTVSLVADGSATVL